MYLPVYSKYFYSKLNEQEKEVYTIISNGWLSYEEQISVRVQSYLDFNKIIKSICCDIPELFYVDFSRITTSYVPGCATIFARFIYVKSEYEAIVKRLKNIVSSIAEEACRFSDKEKYIHDYLAKMFHIVVIHQALMHILQKVLCLMVVPYVKGMPKHLNFYVMLLRFLVLCFLGQHLIMQMKRKITYGI